MESLIPSQTSSPAELHPATPQSRNHILRVKNLAEVWAEDDTAIASTFLDYYQNLFSAEPTLDMDRAIDAIDTKMTGDMNEILMRPFSQDKVRAALSQMHPTKSPGPDGMPAVFFQKFWPFIHTDILPVILNVLNGHSNPRDLNHTLIVLIPKKKDPVCVTDFRPISLCNVIFKIITKTIANRLKSILPALIYHTQSAFVPGRLITDNALLAFKIFHSMKHNQAKNKGSFALKLDMSKAYDRVEWKFLKHAMLKLSIDDRFVNLIMRCVESVSFSILINGQQGDTFYPSRGLRQGDPLSPYLFLFCAEAFSALIRKAELNGNLHGVRICRWAPSISHLFFADDSIIFGRATIQEIEKTREIIKCYEGASGQRISMEKSEISFSKGIDISKRQVLADHMGVNLVEKLAIYLGLPTVVGRKKKDIFNGVIDRVRKKLKNWKGRLLSAAGKMVLIKSIAQAIPTYLMGCFLLPSTTCDSINSLVSNFFWGQKEDEHRIHWCSWKKMSRTKSDGGLGFRDMKCFNEALLAKQCWRLMQDENSLLAKSLKARYFPNTSCLNAPIGYNPSYAWRSIVAGRKVVLKGLRWNIGNGIKVRIWEDPWIPDRPHFRTNKNIQSDRAGKLVADLINWETKSWNFTLLHEWFCTEDIKAIKTIPIRRPDCQDRIVWHYTKNGSYTVKSGYQIAKVLADMEEGVPSTSRERNKIWSWLWHLRVPPKVQTFLWRCIHGALPTSSNLMRRRATSEPGCCRCGTAIETPEHALRDCPWVTFLWAVSPLRIEPDEIMKRGTIADWINFIMVTKDQDSHDLFAMTLWMAWFARNKLVFQNQQIDHKSCLDIAMQRLTEFHAVLEDGAKIRLTRNEVLPEKWTPPMDGFVKINCDTSIRKCIGTGTGAIIRDSRGNALTALHRLRAEELEIDIAEAFACLDEQRKIQRKGDYGDRCLKG
ncbi:hypothetical protein DH2020_000912 [Rehmannia glutinosa]|uniref:Reverse transcriptase domain-containing protein n=1 Tax=Rehmannia glutinosa TaxID=99300 RepID=A0ABR0XYA1_REHGL